MRYALYFIQPVSLEKRIMKQHGKYILMEKWD